MSRIARIAVIVFTVGSLYPLADARAEIVEDPRLLALESLLQNLRRSPIREAESGFPELARLPQEQRREMRQQMREQWQQNPPDNWENRRQAVPATPISQEERYRLREEMREQRRQGRERHGGWH